MKNIILLTTLLGLIIGKCLIRIYFSLFKILKTPILLPKLYCADVYMHEYSNQIESSFLLYFYQRLFSITIFTYIHGQSFNQVSENHSRSKVPQADKSTLLLLLLVVTVYVKCRDT